MKPLIALSILIFCSAHVCVANDWKNREPRELAIEIVKKHLTYTYNVKTEKKIQLEYIKMHNRTVVNEWLITNASTPDEIIYRLAYEFLDGEIGFSESFKKRTDPAYKPDKTLVEQRSFFLKLFSGFDDTSMQQPPRRSK